MLSTPTTTITADVETNPVEKENDIIAKHPTRSLILLDIDDVLNYIDVKKMEPNEHYFRTLFEVSFDHLPADFRCICCKPVINASKEWHEIRWLTMWMESARTHFAPAVGLPDFEHGYVPDQVPYASDMNKGCWVTQWAKKYPENKIVWLEDNAVEFIRTSIDTEEREEEWKEILSSTRILVLAAKIGLEYPRDINLIDAFLQGTMTDDEIRLTNQPFLDDLIKYPLRNRWGGHCHNRKRM